jgi:hypothetical protein
MSDDLHFADPELLPVSHVEIGARLRAKSREVPEERSP